MVKLPYSFLNDLSIFFITPAENAYLNRKLFTEAQEGNKRKSGQWGVRVCVCLCVSAFSLRNILVEMCVALVYLFIKFPNSFFQVKKSR